jgi:protein-S-isoprenylcysteine O-methyltransferase Ste14
MKPRIPPPVIALLAGLAMAGLHRWWPLARCLRGAWRDAGFVLMAMGVATGLLAIASFRAADTTHNPLDPARATALVQSGPFRYTRNPMYVGLALVLSGWAWWLGTATPWLVLPVFVVLITRLQIAPEERALQALFGEAYAGYRRRVPRWLGWPARD